MSSPGASGAWVVSFHEDTPPGWTCGVQWSVLLHDRRGVPVPCAATVSDFTRCRILSFVYLEYVGVAAHCRRQGFATQLVVACLDRWPDLVLSPALGAAGAALIERVERAAGRRLRRWDGSRVIEPGAP